MSVNRRQRKKRRQAAALLAALILLLALLTAGWIYLNKQPSDEEAGIPPQESSIESSSESESTMESESSSQEPSSEETSETEESSEEPAEESSEESSEEISEETEESSEEIENSSEEPENPEEEEWNLILVNRTHPLPENYEVPEFTELRNNNRVDSRIYPDLQQMFDDMRSLGYAPYITTSYRSHEEQIEMMNYYIRVYQEQGYSEEEAADMAAGIVALPGTSEHELGMAVDISTEDHEANDPYIMWDWLAAHSYEYGFILRYPEEKTEITGIDYEPWHFRYVGKKAAKEIFEQGVCLEEYLGLEGE